MNELTLQSLENLPKVAGEYEIIVPKTMEETLKAQKNLLQIAKERTSFVSDFKPYKQKVDEFKKQLLDYEKEQVQKVEYYEKIQEGEIKKFKTEILLAQRFVQDTDLKIRTQIENLKRKGQELLLSIEKWNAQVELEIVQNSKEPISEKIDIIELKIEEVKEIEKTVIPEIEVKPIENFVLKKHQVKTKMIYSVQDEKAFIEWALVHARDLLKIEIVKSKFNALSEEQKKQIPGVVGREEV